jgi:predicted Ser/Thr protein kinase
MLKEFYMDWLEEVNNEKERTKQILSFSEYMDILDESPKRELRTTAQYLKDMFEFFGTDEKGRFKLFKKEHPGAPQVAGQFRTQEKIYDNLLNFTEEGFNNKFILLVGPNGSSKSSLIKKIMKSMEDYSKLDEGSLFTFSWIFPIDKHTKGSLGLSSNKTSKHIESFAHLEDVEISAILTSELKDHPFLIIPLKIRQKMINDYLKDDSDLLQSVSQSYLYNGDLSKRNKLIFDALLKSYHNDYEEVFKHIRVERFNIDKRYSVGAATIEPQLHVDAKLQQITMDKRLATLPPSLQSLNLFNLNGEVVLSNRGILEFSDLLKRPLDTFKYLLMTMETKSINLQGILTELDIFFMGSSNEVHFEAFKQHPDFKSFKGRFSFLKVPYLLDYKEEKLIYMDQVRNVKDKAKFEPHALEALCLWSVMTRMRHPQAKNYKDTKLSDIAEKLTPIEKALFIASGDIPDYLNQEEGQLLKVCAEEIRFEFENDPMYEGKFGISPREVKQIIYEISNEEDVVTFIEVIEYLKELSERKEEYDFLNIGPQGDYHNPKKFLYQVEQFCLNLYDNELRDSLGLVDNRSYEGYIRKYVQHITAIIKNEKLKNEVTGKFEDPDMYYIKEFETNIHMKENADSFRSHILSKLGAYSLDNPGKEIVYTDVLDNISKLLKETFRNEQKKIIDNVGKNLLFYIDELEDKKNDKPANSGIKPETRKQIVTILDHLMNNHGYSERGSINCLKFLLKKRYDSAH